jgi:hypothetical protein
MEFSWLRDDHFGEADFGHRPVLTFMRALDADAAERGWRRSKRSCATIVYKVERTVIHYAG